MQQGVLTQEPDLAIDIDIVAIESSGRFPGRSDLRLNGVERLSSEELSSDFIREVSVEPLIPLRIHVGEVVGQHLMALGRQLRNTGKGVDLSGEVQHAGFIGRAVKVLPPNRVLLIGIGSSPESHANTSRNTQTRVLLSITHLNAVVVSPQLEFHSELCSNFSTRDSIESSDPGHRHIASPRSCFHPDSTG